MIKENLVKYFEDSIKQNWDKPALSDYKGWDFAYSDIAENILIIHKILKYYGINKDDKIALIGKNSAKWGISLLSIISYGAVVVPILPDFKPGDVHHIVNHSDSLLLISSDTIFETLEYKEMNALQAIISVETNQILACKHGEIEDEQLKLDKKINEYPDNQLSADSFELPESGNEKLALISYTSGTTGNSKGVMLLHNSIAANIRFAQNNMPLKSGDKIVSFLPMAHAYGLAFEFLFPFTLGCHITFLTKTPSPQIIIEAFKEIKPRLILSVPLVIEKIFKKRLLPVISKPIYKALMAIPLINQLIFSSIKKKLSGVFGNNFHEIIIGGAPFNAEAERFFKRIRFPFTVGYGMTECGPLISYASWDSTVLGASGRSVDSLTVRIDSEDPEKTEGEICIKGENVMLGYYKNEKATKEAIDSDGWLHTGDLGIIDKKGNIHIKGRSKSMILGASGQNIFPEEIESILNNMNGVLESLVIEEDGKLVALIFPDQEVINKDGLEDQKLDEIMKRNIKELNHSVPTYMQVTKYKIQDEEFIKTPKRNIKRFLYT
jgi:long-chain acyl-CoA synthetase